MNKRQIKKKNKLSHYIADEYNLIGMSPDELGKVMEDAERFRKKYCYIKKYKNRSCKLKKYFYPTPQAIQKSFSELAPLLHSGKPKYTYVYQNIEDLNRRFMMKY